MQVRRKNYLIEFISKPVVLSIFLLAIFIAIALPLFKNIKQQYAINSEISQLDNEIKQFEAKNTSLKDKIKYLQSDQFTNEQAKLNLNYKKPGEEVVVISTSTAVPESEDEKTENQKELSDDQQNTGVQNPTLWWRYFFY